MTSSEKNIKKYLYQQKALKTKVTTQKTSITQRMRTDLGWLVGVAEVIKLVRLNRFSGDKPSNYTQKLCNQMDININNCKQKHPDIDQRPTTN